MGEYRFLQVHAIKLLNLGVVEHGPYMLSHVLIYQLHFLTCSLPGQPLASSADKCFSV